MSQNAEVKVKLVFDKAASDAAKKLTDEMKGVGKVVVDTNAKTKTLGQTAIGVMKGWGAEAKKALEPIANLKKAGELAGGALGGLAKVGAAGVVAGVAASVGIVFASASAAAEKAERVKALTASMISFSPNKNVSYSTAREAAKAYDDDFRRIALGSGAMSSDVARAFGIVAAQTNNAGQAFGQFGGRARLTLADTKQIATDMAGASKIVPGGLAQLTDEYEQLKSGIFSSQGAIVQMVTTTGVLKGNAVEVARQLASKDTITRMKLAEEAMKRMAKSAAVIPMGFAGLKNAFGEVKDLALESIGEPIVNALLPKLNSVRDYFAANADKIEIVATKIGGSIASFVDGGSKIVDSLYTTLGGEGSKLGEWVTASFGFAKSAWGWIVDHADPLAKTFRDVFNVILTSIERAFALLQSASIKLGLSDGEDTKVTKDNYDSIHAAQAKAAGSGAMTEKETNFAAQRAKGVAEEAGLSKAEAQRAADDIYDAQKRFQAGVAGFATSAKVFAGGDFVDAYNKATVQHDEASLAYAQSLLRGNTALQLAMLSSGKEIEGGFSSLAKSIGDNDFLKLARTSAQSALGTKPLAPQVQFNGAVFNIKQDFRDQDPDRVAIVFRNDIAKQAQYRSGSALSQAYGP